MKVVTLFIRCPLSLNLKGTLAFIFLQIFHLHFVSAQSQGSFSNTNSIISIPTYLHPDSTFASLKEQMLLHRQNGNSIAEANCLNEMGLILYHLGNYSQAMKHLIQAQKILRILDRPGLLAANLNVLGTVYYYNQQPDEAWIHFREALSIYQKNENVSGIATTFGNIGHMYEKRLQYDSAYVYQIKALEIARRTKDTPVLARIYEHLGSIHEDKGIYDSARYYFTISLEAHKLLGNHIDQIEVINNLGDVWSKTGNFVKGLSYAKEAASLASITGQRYQLQTAYRDMAQCFAALQLYDSAYSYLEKSRDLVQRLYAMENSYHISLLQTIYETEKKNATIQRLASERKITALLYTAVIVVLLMLALTGVLIISRQKLKLKNEKTLNDSNQQIFLTQKGLMESELKRQQLEETSLKQQLEIKSRELSSHILHLIQKNEVMEEIKSGLNQITRDDKRDHKKQIRQLLQKINTSFSQDSYWESFRQTFDNVHPTFMQEIQKQASSLTPSELRLLALLKMNLTASDQSTLLGITSDSLRVLRYRVKKKLGLGQEQSLMSFVHNIG